MSIYIITNREVKNEVIARDGREKAGFGFRVGELNNGAITLFKDFTGADYLNIQDQRENGTAKLFIDLYENLISYKERADVLFYIHGFDYSLTDEIKHMQQLKKIYLDNSDSPIKHLIYFSWPTKANYDYEEDQNDTIISGQLLGRLFGKVRQFYTQKFKMDKQQRCRNRIHLAVHSMGNQVLSHFVEAVTDSIAFPLFSEILLLNSDVDWRIFEKEQAFSRLIKFGERIHIYINRSDDALRISRLSKNFHQRLGSRGPSNLDTLPPETFIVDTTDVNAYNPNISLKERTLDHWGYLERQAVIGDIINVFLGIDEDDIATREKSINYQRFFSLKG